MRLLDSGPVLARITDTTVVVTLNRPEVRNAIDVPTRILLIEVLAEADASDDVRVVVVTGTDPAFCGGLDLKALAVSLASGPPPGPNPGQALRAVSKPVIAAVNGPCVTGGLEIALSCDFIIASDRSSFADTHARRGLTPGERMWGMSALLPEAVGRRRAKELSLTGRFVAPPEALDIGLVNQVVAHDDLIPTALKLAEAVAAAPPEATAAWLRVYDLAAGHSLDESLRIEAGQSAPDSEERL
jgi:enoyl-CoA hydratase